MAEAAELQPVHLSRCWGCGAIACIDNCASTRAKRRKQRRRRPGPQRIRRRRAGAAKPSQFRVGRWQQLRYWLDHKHELDQAKMHKPERIFAARDAGKLYHVEIPHLDVWEFQSPFTLRFIVLLTLTCCHRAHGHFMVSNAELADLLGCSKRWIYNVTREAVDRGYCLIRPMYERVDDSENPQCRCGHSHSAGAEAPCTDCGCMVLRPLLHRQLANAYAPGWRLKRLWSHWEAYKGQLADLMEGGTDCDPTPTATTPALEDHPAAVVDPPRPITGGPSGSPHRRAALTAALPAASAADQGQARGLAAASRPARASPDAGGGPRPLPSKLTGQKSTDRATVPDRSDGARAAAAAPPVWSAMRFGLPEWLTTSSGDLQELAERGDLWVRLTESGAPESEIAAAVAQLRLDQERRRKGGGAGAVCRGQPRASP